MIKMSAKTLTHFALKAFRMANSVGFNAQASCMAMRAGISDIVQGKPWDICNVAIYGDRPLKAYCKSLDEFIKAKRKVRKS
jgi:hypothetical protein